MRPLRVLYAPRNIAGQAEQYARCIRGLGHQAEVWSYGPPAFGFGADRVIDVGQFRSDPDFRWSLLDEAVRRFDVFHFQYGRSLLMPELPELPPLAELPLLASLGKKLIMNFRGSDIRLRSKHVAREPDSYMRDQSIPCDEERIMATVATARRYCDAVLVSTPGLLDYVPDAIWLPHVVDIDWWAKESSLEPDVPRVAHMPSRRSTKASNVVERVGRALDARGVVEYVELTGLSRDQVRDEFHRVDVVVDSLSIGDHGLVSVEAMAAGAIAIAHVHERNRARNAGVPVVEATVHDLEYVLVALAADPDRRREIKRRSQEWVREHHSMVAVGGLLVDLYRRPIRRSGLSDPSFPIVADAPRVRHLERELEELRAQLADPDRRLVRRRLTRRFGDHFERVVLPRGRRFAYRTGIARLVVGVRRRLMRWRAT